MNASPETAVKANSKIHTVYKLKDGTRVPSVTTILSELNKPALVPWAWKLGTQGIDYRGYVDALASIGTLAHKMILDHLRGDKTDLGEYAATMVDLASNCFLSFLAWERGHVLKPVMLETPLVSESLRYGGTMDYYGTIDGTLTVMDFKTGKGIYDEHFMQGGAYMNLIIENGNDAPAAIRILNIGRAENEEFAEKSIGAADMGRQFEIFRHALAIYQLKKAK